MFKKYFLASVLLLATSAGFGQFMFYTETNSTAKTLGVKIERAYAAQQQKSPLQQLDFLLQEAYTHAENAVLSNAAANPSVPGTKPWQVAAFLPDPKLVNIQQTLSQISAQIRSGYVAVGTVFYKPSQQEAVLYILYEKSRVLRQEKIVLPADVSPVLAWENILKHFKNHPSFYTGILEIAHSFTSSFRYDFGRDTHFTVLDITQAISRQQLHVDILELDSCYAASLYNLYHFANVGRIDYVIASANSRYATQNFLHFLNTVPAQVAASTAQAQSKEFTFNRSFLTNNSAALNLKALKRPLLEYIRAYKELFSYQQSDEIYTQPFHSFFGSKENFLQNLGDIAAKQAAFLRSRMSPQLPALYQAQQEFVQACDNLRTALQHATMNQWCYSQKHDRVYTQSFPAGSECLGSVNVTWDQYQDLWE